MMNATSLAHALYLAAALGNTGDIRARTVLEVLDNTTAHDIQKLTKALDITVRLLCRPESATGHALTMALARSLLEAIGQAPVNATLHSR